MQIARPAGHLKHDQHIPVIDRSGLKLPFEQRNLTTALLADRRERSWSFAEWFRISATNLLNFMQSVYSFSIVGSRSSTDRTEVS
jgi:hypothetical protein